MSMTLVFTIISDIITYAPQVIALVQNGIKAYDAVQQTAPNLVPNLEKLFTDLFPGFDASALAKAFTESVVTSGVVKVTTYAWNPAVPR